MSKTLPKFIVLNGKIVPYGEATTHVMSPAVKYGLSVFEGLRAYWSEADQDLYIFRLKDHTDRLVQSMKLLRFEADFSGADIDAATIELLRRNGIKASAHIRTTVYLDGMGEQQATGPVSYSISALERPRAAKVDKGIRCQISSWMRMADNVMPPRIKCGGNYVNGRLARYQAIKDGYDEAIILNTLGKVAEGPGTCIFFVRRGELVTPDLASGILESITRETVLTLAQGLGIKTSERMVDRTELYAADEVFMVGSAAEIVPVVDIDGIAIGAGAPGETTKRLQAAYFDAVTGVGTRRPGWLTPVYKGR
jgi:branched-chain amino acid aminotransferase